jgi:hypothetical protein
VGGLRHDLGDQVAVDIGQAHVAAIEKIGQAGVVDAQQVQHGGVKVVDRDGLALGFVAELVTGADDLAAVILANPDWLIH